MTESKVGERLAERPAPEITQYLYGARISEDRDSSFGYMTAVNQAHVVMLARQGIIKPDTARSLLNAIDDIVRGGAANLPLDDEREDLFFNYEHAVILRTNATTGGQMHTGRSRNDLGATITRMRCRDVLISLLTATLELRSALLDQAAAHVDTLLPGYTHLQPAQPITVGHYLTAIASGLARDSERLWHALQQTNLSPLGAAALAGTGYPIDRDLTARLLGFDGLVVNTLDGVASRDYFLASLAAAGILGVTLSRFAQDLFVWYSAEFGMIDFRDRIAGTSSIMPQKKNPIVLENIKGRTAHAIGAFSAAAAAIHNSHYTNVIDANREGLRLGWTALDEMRISIILAQLAITNVIIRADVMAARCRDNFSTVTQLADSLVAAWGISFRQAHEVVGGVVRQAIDQGRNAAAIDAELVRQSARDVLGHDGALDPELVEQALDPRHNVLVRSHPGGPAPGAVRQMIADARDGIESDRAKVSHVQSRIEEGQRELSDAIQGMLAI